MRAAGEGGVGAGVGVVGGVVTLGAWVRLWAMVVAVVMLEVVDSVWGLSRRAGVVVVMWKAAGASESKPQAALLGSALLRWSLRLERGLQGNVAGAPWCPAMVSPLCKAPYNSIQPPRLKLCNRGAAAPAASLALFRTARTQDTLCALTAVQCADGWSRAKGSSALKKPGLAGPPLRPVVGYSNHPLGH